MRSLRVHVWAVEPMNLPFIRSARYRAVGHSPLRRVHSLLEQHLLFYGSIRVLLISILTQARATSFILSSSPHSSYRSLQSSTVQYSTGGTQQRCPKSSGALTHPWISITTTTKGPHLPPALSQQPRNLVERSDSPLALWT